MKIIHVCISERYVEGDSYHENILPTKHIKMGYDVTVVASQYYFDGRTKSMKHRDTADYVNKDGIHVIILPSRKGNKYSQLFFGTVEGLYETIDKVKPDVIFVHGVKSSDNATITKYVQHHKEVKVFADNHNDYHVTPLKKGIGPWIARQIAVRNARLLLPVAQKFWGTLPLRADYLHTVFHIPKEKIDVLVMGGDEDFIINRDVNKVRKEIRTLYGIPQDAFLVVTGGVFDERKQQVLLMKAIQAIENDKIWLIAFGEPSKGMEMLFEPYREEKRIVMTGWLPSDKAYDVFLASDLAFFPGWHSVLWEQAVACGIPLVAKYWEGVDHVNFNGNAILMPHVNVDEIKQTIEELFNTNKYQIIKNKAIEAAPNYYMCHIANKAIGIK